MMLSTAGLKRWHVPRKDCLFFAVTASLGESGSLLPLLNAHLVFKGAYHAGAEPLHLLRRVTPVPSGVKTASEHAGLVVGDLGWTCCGKVNLLSCSAGDQRSCSEEEWCGKGVANHDTYQCEA